MRRFSVIFSLLAIMLLVIGAAHAQFGRAVACGELSEEDCSLLNRSQTAMAGLTSAEFDLSSEFSVTGLAGDEPATFTIDGDGSFSGDISAFYTEPEDLQAMMADPTASLQAIADVVGDFDATLNLTIGLPDVLTAFMTDIPSEIPLELALVDGVGYVNFAPLVEIAGEDGASLPQGWAGLDLSGALNMAVMMADSQSDMSDMQMFSLDMDTLSQLQSPEFLNQYTIITREADGTSVDGEEVAVFSTTYDFQGLTSDPLFVQAMRDAAEAQDSTMSDDELQEGLDEISNVFEGLTFTQTTSIGIDDALIRSLSSDLSLDFSAVEDEDMQDQLGDASFTVSFVINFHNLNNAAAITAPEGATVTTVQDLMSGSMSGGMGTDPMNMTPTNTAGADATTVPAGSATPTGAAGSATATQVAPTLGVTLPVGTATTVGPTPVAPTAAPTDGGILPTLGITIEPPILPTAS